MDSRCFIGSHPRTKNQTNGLLSINQNANITGRYQRNLGFHFLPDEFEGNNTGKDGFCGHQQQRYGKDVSGDDHHLQGKPPLWDQDEVGHGNHARQGP